MHLVPDIGYLFDSTSGRVYNSRHVMCANRQHSTTRPLDYGS